MLNTQYLNILKIIYERLKKANITWYVIGKTNLAIQGINVQLSRLGIMIKHEDLQPFLKIFSDFDRTEVELLENGEAEEFNLFIDDIDVLVCAEYSYGTYFVLNNKPMQVELDNMQINCLSLDAEKQAYMKLGLYNKVEHLFVNTKK